MRRSGPTFLHKLRNALLLVEQFLKGEISLARCLALILRTILLEIRDPNADIYRRSFPFNNIVHIFRFVLLPFDDS